MTQHLDLAPKGLVVDDDLKQTATDERLGHRFELVERGVGAGDVAPVWESVAQEARRREAGSAPVEGRGQQGNELVALRELRLAVDGIITHHV